ncbi:hypothetical protein CR513_52997, partial [Mucuna pruriens]
MLQLDINDAFLNKDLFEEVYMQARLGYPIKGYHDNGFKIFPLLSLVVSSNNAQFIILSSLKVLTSLILFLVYVNNIVITSSQSFLLHDTQLMVESHLKLKIIGDLLLPWPRDSQVQKWYSPLPKEIYFATFGRYKFPQL